MSFSFISDCSFHELTDITPEFLAGRGVTLLLIDLDNTIAPYGRYEPTSETVKWAERMRRAGITLFIVSNSHSVGRTAGFAAALGIPFINRAKKPSPRGIREAMSRCGKMPEETALAGDQSYTDVLAANLAGALSLLVHPLSLRNPLLAIRYVLELPWRLSCKEKVK